MSELIIAVTAISLIGILAEVLLTEGQTKKYIQGVMALAVVLVILVNVVKIVKGADSVKDYLDIRFEEPAMTDTKSANEIEMLRFEKARLRIVTTLENSGVEGVIISFTYGYNERNAPFIQNIFADTSSAVIKKGYENINIIEMIVDACQSVVDISKEGIIIDGKISTERQA
ncbi:MAG TPA: hypothetical protein PKY53_01035 [Clostridia bacterium]|jgi:hypothetical protein|nr:hypothetical protein [Clostridia bacterium]